MAIATCTINNVIQFLLCMHHGAIDNFNYNDIARMMYSSRAIYVIQDLDVYIAIHVHS